MSTIFIDTSALYALNVSRDQDHQKALSVLKTLRQSNIQIVTTDYVIDEAATTILTARKGSFYEARNLLKWIFSKESFVTLIWITQERFYQARRVFERYSKDKQWSFTDCTSYVVMKELKIKTAFTFDDHFKQMRFSLL